MIESKKRSSLGRNSSPGMSTSMKSGSKLKELLAEDEATESSEAVSMKHRGTDVKASFSNFVVKTCEYDYPRIGQVPADFYYSVIADMQVREKDGREILDVCYDIEDRYGREYHILQSYPAGSRPFKQLATALVAAGVPNGATVDAGIGVCEIINLDYVSKKSDFGSIIERRPYVAPSGYDDQEESDELVEEDD